MRPRCQRHTGHLWQNGEGTSKPSCLAYKNVCPSLSKRIFTLPTSSGGDQVDIPVCSPIWSQLQAQLCLVQKLEKIHLCSTELTGVPCGGGTIGSSVC